MKDLWGSISRITVPFFTIHLCLTSYRTNTTFIFEDNRHFSSATIFSYSLYFFYNATMICISE